MNTKVLKDQGLVSADQKKENNIPEPFFPSGSDMMTQNEVAKMFDRTVQTIINWKNKGKIPYYEIDGRPIFSRKQLIKVALKNQHLLNQ